MVSSILNFSESSKEHQFYVTMGLCHAIQCFDYFLRNFFSVGTFQNLGAPHVIILIQLLLVAWGLKTAWVQIILFSFVGGYILIYFHHSEAFSFFKCWGVCTKASSTLSMFSDWATPTASRNINEQVVFPGNMLDSEDREVRLIWSLLL